MPPERRGEFLSQAQEQNERSGKSYIKGIADMVGPSGKAYKQVELGDGTRLRFFDPKAIEGLSVGQEVNFTMQKNERGYWNPTAISPALPEAAAKTEASATIQPPQERGSERFYDRDRQILSMNALTASATTFAAMLPYLETKPTRMSQAVEMIKQTHAALMQLHEPGKDNAGSGTP